MSDDEERRKAARAARKNASAEPGRENAKAKLKNGVDSAKETANRAGEFVTPLIDGVIDAFGGVSVTSLVGVLTALTDCLVLGAG